MKPVRIQITEHAIDRYIKRWEPGIPRQVAHAKLVEAAKTSVPLRSNTIRGQEQRHAVDLDCTLVVKRDNLEHMAVVTVLPAPREMPADQAELIEHYVELLRTRPAVDPIPEIAPVEEPVWVAAMAGQIDGAERLRDEAQRAQFEDAQRRRREITLRHAIDAHRGACRVRTIRQALRVAVKELARCAEYDRGAGRALEDIVDIEPTLRSLLDATDTPETETDMSTALAAHEAERRGA